MSVPPAAAGAPKKVVPLKHQAPVLSKSGPVLKNPGGSPAGDRPSSVGEEQAVKGRPGQLASSARAPGSEVRRSWQASSSMRPQSMNDVSAAAPAANNPTSPTTASPVLKKVGPGSTAPALGSRRNSSRLSGQNMLPDDGTTKKSPRSPRIEEASTADQGPPSPKPAPAPRPAPSQEAPDLPKLPPLSKQGSGPLGAAKGPAPIKVGTVKTPPASNATGPKGPLKQPWSPGSKAPLKRPLTAPPVNPKAPLKSTGLGAKSPLVKAVVLPAPVVETPTEKRRDEPDGEELVVEPAATAPATPAVIEEKGEDEAASFASSPPTTAVPTTPAAPAPAVPVFESSETVAAVAQDEDRDDQEEDEPEEDDNDRDGNLFDEVLAGMKGSAGGTHEKTSKEPPLQVVSNIDFGEEILSNARSPTMAPAAPNEEEQESGSMLDLVWSELSQPPAQAQDPKPQGVTPTRMEPQAEPAKQSSTALDDVYDEILGRGARSPAKSSAERSPSLETGSGEIMPAKTPPAMQRPPLGEPKARPRSVKLTSKLTSSPNVTIRPAARERAGSVGPGPLPAVEQSVEGPSRLSRIFQRRDTVSSPCDIMFNLAERDVNSRPQLLRLVDDVLVVAASDTIYLRSRITEEGLGCLPFLNARLIQSDSRGRLWVAGPKDPTICVFDLKDAASKGPLMTLAAHTGWITGLEAVANGSLMCTSSADMSIRVWDTVSMSTQRVFKDHTDWITAMVQWGNYLISGSCDKGIRVWHLAGSSEKKEKVAKAMDKDLFPAQLKEDQSVRVLYGHENWVLCLVVEENTLWSAGRDLALIKWNLDKWTKETTITLANNPVKMQLVNNNKYLCVVDDAFVISLFRKGRLVHKLNGHLGKIRGLAWSDRFLFSCSEDKTVRVWKTASGQCVEVLKSHQDAVNDLLFEKRTGGLLSCSDDGTVRVWRVAAVAAEPGSKNVGGSVASTGVTSANSGASVATTHHTHMRQQELMRKDPVYASAVRLQSIYRMRVLRKSFTSYRDLMVGSRSRYQVLRDLIAFYQGHLALLLNLTEGFLVPLRSSATNAAFADAGMTWKMDDLDALVSVLQKIASYCTSLLERLTAELENFPFIFLVGRQLFVDASDSVLYTDLLTHVHILSELALVVEAGAQSSFAQLLEKAEAQAHARIDRLVPKTFLWALMRFAEGMNLPVATLATSSPGNQIDVNEALRWWVRVSSVSLALKQGVERVDSVVRFTTVYKSFALEDSQDCATLASQAGSLVRDDQAQLKYKLRKEPVRLVLFSKGILLVGSDVSGGGGKTKDKVQEVLRLKDVSSTSSNKSGEITIIMNEGVASGQASGSRRGASASSGKTLVYSFATKEAAEAFFAELDLCVRLARHRITDKPLDVQLTDARAARSIDGNTVPDYVIALVQAMDAASADAAVDAFRLPVTAFKVSGLSVAFDGAADPKMRVSSLVPLLSTCGYQNLLTGLLIFLKELPEPLIAPSAFEFFARASSVEDVKRALALVSPKMRPILVAVFHFLRRLVNAFEQKQEWNVETSSGVIAAQVAPYIFWQKEPARLIGNAHGLLGACSVSILQIREIAPEVPTTVKFSEIQTTSSTSAADVAQRKKAIKEKYEAEERERKAAQQEKEKAEVLALKAKLADEENASRERAELQAAADKKRLEVQMAQRLGSSQETGAFAEFLKQQEAAKARAQEIKARQSALRPESPALSRPPGTHPAAEGGVASMLGDLDGIASSHSPMMRRPPGKALSAANSPAARSPAVSASLNSRGRLSNSSGSVLSFNDSSSSLPASPMMGSKIEGQPPMTDSVLEAAMATIDPATIPLVNIPSLDGMRRKPGQALIKIPEVPPTMEKKTRAQ